jgi:hypothetical protein
VASHAFGDPKMWELPDFLICSTGWEWFNPGSFSLVN